MGGEVSLKLPFILGHVDESEVKTEQFLATKTSSTEIIEEGHNEILTITDFKEANIEIDKIEKLNLKRGSKHESNKKTDDDSDDEVAIGINTIQLDERFKVTRVEDHKDMQKYGTGDINEDSSQELNAKGVNIITAQIHHHSHQQQSSTEETTDC